jgi:hypothetical protein
VSSTEIVTILNRTERWFVSVGLPRLIADFSARSQVIPRTLPFLVGSALAWLLGLTPAPMVVTYGAARPAAPSRRAGERRLPKSPRDTPMTSVTNRLPDASR